MNHSKSDIWMPVYIGDLLGDTQHLTNEQFGIYHKLLYHQWRHGHFSEEEMATIAGYSSPAYESASSTSQVELKQAFSRVLAPIKQMLTQDQAGLWFSRRCDAEKVRWFEKKRVFTERARKGGLAKARRIREQKSASSTASRVPEGVLESYTSPSQVKQKQKQPPPTPSAARRGTRSAARPPGGSPASKPQVPPAPAAVPGVVAIAARPAQTKSEQNTKPPGKAVGAIGNGVRHRYHQPISMRTVQQSGGAIVEHRGKAPERVLAARMQGEVFAYWNAGGVVGFDCPWSEKEDRALEALLRSQPKLDLPHFKQLLRNRADSEAITRSDPPHKWLRQLLKYAEGPQDRFGKPLRPRRTM